MHSTVAVPELGDALPRSGGPVSRALGRLGLRLLGWRIEGVLPNIPKAVLVLAPHSSNWDFVVGIAAKFALGLRASWLGKDSLFRGPVAPVMRWLGGIPVNRAEPQDVVAQVVRRFGDADRLVLGLAPEGTRRRVARWRSGYYHIAHGATVPIVPVAFDWSRRALVVGTPLRPGRNQAADMQVLAAFFEPMRGRRGERAAPPS